MASPAVKIMQKLGYHSGKGLGKDGQGEIVPVGDVITYKYVFDRSGVGLASSSVGLSSDSVEKVESRIINKFNVSGTKRPRPTCRPTEAADDTSHVTLGEPEAKSPKRSCGGLVSDASDETGTAARNGDEPAREESTHPTEKEEPEAMGTGKRVSVAARRKQAAVHRKAAWEQQLKACTDCPAYTRKQCSSPCPHGYRHRRHAPDTPYCKHWCRNISRVPVNSFPCIDKGGCLLLHPPLSIVQHTDCTKYVTAECPGPCSFRHAAAAREAAKTMDLNLCMEWRGLQGEPNVGDEYRGGCSAGASCPSLHHETPSRPDTGEGGATLRICGAPRARRLAQLR